MRLGVLVEEDELGLGVNGLKSLFVREPITWEKLVQRLEEGGLSSVGLPRPNPVVSKLSFSNRQ